MSICLLAEAGINIFHEFARLQSMVHWQWLALCAVCLIVFAGASVVSWLDSRELPAGLRWLLVSLRWLGLLGILFYFADLERRSERRLVKDSRILLLVDTSLSMGIQDESASDDSPAQRRIDSVIKLFAGDSFLAGLRDRHDLVVYRFDQHSMPQQVAAFPKRKATMSVEEAYLVRRHQFQSRVNEARRIALAAGTIGLLAWIAGTIFLAGHFGGAGSGNAWWLTFSLLGLVGATMVLAYAHLSHPGISLPAVVGLTRPKMPTPESDLHVEDPQETKSGKDVDWGETLMPQGSATRLGDALRFLVDQERGGPIAGIIVLTDGANNAGADAKSALIAAADAGVPVFPIGLGSARRQANVGLVDLVASSRATPGDKFGLTGFLQAYALPGRTVTVELLSQDFRNDAQPDAFEFEEEQRITLGKEGEVIPVLFEVTPKQAGKLTYRLRVVPPRQDHDPRDNELAVTVDVVERKSRVLLFAGGPTREFRFLRNLLYRDTDTTLDVLLQTGKPGMSQEADQLLFAFPETPAELFEYDAIVAFDPDWLALSESQVQLLERWVADKAGGLVLVAGAVQTPRWTGRAESDMRVKILKDLYPVTFHSRRLATMALGRFSAEAAWPLHLTEDGLDAEFLWLEDDRLVNAQRWSDFKGVYGYCAVRGPKRGAHVYAQFSDTSTSFDGKLPVYFVSQSYVAGRVFFEASGEMWRLRALDEGYFERFYTKLIRWVSQGRLRRGSTHGVLMVDKERCLLGEQVVVRASLVDSQYLPLSIERVNATLVDPGGRRSTLAMLRAENAARKGMYHAQFTAALEGVYRVELQPPHGGADEVLNEEVRARIPARETESPLRNDALLKELADKTGGAYYVGMEAATGGARTPVASLLLPQDQVTYLPRTPDVEFKRLLMTWLLVLICGVFCLEWLIRRLVKLA